MTIATITCVAALVAVIALLSLDNWRLSRRSSGLEFEIIQLITRGDPFVHPFEIDDPWTFSGKVAVA